jgi:hypothetical protein
MTYGRERCASAARNLDGATVSHLAELVRGESNSDAGRPPHPPLRGTLSPKGEGISRRSRHDHPAHSASLPR